MTSDDRELTALLTSDAERLAKSARLSSPQQALWRAKLKRARDRQSRVAHVVAFTECTVVGLVAAVLVAIAWRNLGVTPPSDHPMTVVALALTSAVAAGVLIVVPQLVRSS
jgi:anti-sigma-K factor RskA